MMKRLICILMSLAAMISFCACGEKPSDGLAEGSIDITADNLPKIVSDEHFGYIGSSLAAALLRAYSKEKVEGLTESVASSDEAYARLLNGECDIVIGYEPSEEASAELENGGISLQTVTVGYDALVFFASPSNGVTKLSPEQLTLIFGGSIKKWSELGGADIAVSAFSASSNSFENAWFKRSFPLETEAASVQNKLTGDDGVFTSSVDYDNRPGAIGCSLYSKTPQSGVGGKREMISVDGVLPSDETLKNGSYPYTKRLVIAARTSFEADSVTQLVFDWLQSTQGTEFLSRF